MQSTLAQTSTQQKEAGSHRSVAESLREYGRGIAGGLLFSLPLLYTMEMWQAGITMHPLRLLAGVAATIVLLLGYNRYAGLREDAGWTEIAIDSIEELGLGFVLAAAILAMLGRITTSMPTNEVMGKIVVEAMTMAIGVSIGTAQLGASGDATDGDDQGGDDEEDAKPTFASQVVLGFCGAMLIASNVAPTEEIIKLAVELRPWYVVGLAAVSLLLAALILFFSGFHAAARVSPQQGPLSIVTGAMVNYAIALLASAGALWFFDSLAGLGYTTGMAAVVVLGVASTLGASAGRLLIQAASGEQGTS
jgi:putative integral membrane protein (TIGR02587 family)